MSWNIISIVESPSQLVDVNYKVGKPNMKLSHDKTLRRANVQDQHIIDYLNDNNLNQEFVTTVHFTDNGNLVENHEYLIVLSELYSKAGHKGIILLVDETASPPSDKVKDHKETKGQVSNEIGG